MEEVRKTYNLHVSMAMVNEHPHRYAVVLSVSVLILIALGAFVTSRATAPQLDSHRILDANVHRIVAVVLGILAIGVVVWHWQAIEGPILVWTALSVFMVEAWVGWLGRAVLHASLAPLTFASLVAVVVATSRGWNEAPELVDDRGVPFLRLLAITAPLLVLLQTVLGATYRHKLTGLMPHLGGAMIVSLATLVSAMLVLRQYPKHRALRSAAIWLMSIVLGQVALGVTAFIMQLLELRNPMALVISTASHVVVGSLTLAASLVLAMQVQRHVRHASTEAVAKSS